MKLTKLQRYTAYCIILSQMEISKNDGFLCFVIRNLDINVDAKGFIRKYLKELYDKVPIERRNQYAWWQTPYNKTQRSYRIELLQQCIEETHP